MFCSATIIVAFLSPIVAYAPEVLSVMSHARGVIKTLVFLKRFMHQPWENAVKKWKGEQTTQAIAMYLAKTDDEDAATIIKKIVECHQFPTSSMVEVFRHYRELRVMGAVKGRVNKKNVMVINTDSVWVEQSLLSELSAPMAPVDVESIVEKHNLIETDIQDVS